MKDYEGKQFMEGRGLKKRLVFYFDQVCTIYACGVVKTRNFNLLFEPVKESE
ncbi:MAG: hypothetical protein ACYDAO_02645 [Thermoplasmataceae archaeon]